MVFGLIKNVRRKHHGAGARSALSAGDYGINIV